MTRCEASLRRCSTTLYKLLEQFEELWMEHVDKDPTCPKCRLEALLADLERIKRTRRGQAKEKP